MHFFVFLALVLGTFVLVGCGSSDSTSSAPWEITVDQLHPDIRSIYADSVYGPLCGNPLKCNNVVVIDCGSATDGPRNYYDNLTGEVIMYCGGACLLPQVGDPKVCAACPPPEWTCT